MAARAGAAEARSLLQEKTVLILGAGASYDFGLPLGSDLKNRISHSLKLNSDTRSLEPRRRTISGEIQRYCHTRGIKSEIGKYYSLAEIISQGVIVADSIDEYVERTGSDGVKIVAKMAIASLIIESERKSSLWFNSSNINNSIDFELVIKNGSWIQKLFSKLRLGISYDNIDSIFENFNIISFNYDRCIVHYLYHAIKMFWNLNADDAFQLISKINIIFPYGTVGEYIPAFHPGEVGCVEFGDIDVHASDIFQNIDTYSEYNSSKTRDRIHQALQDVEKLIFLGCHYHRQNLEILTMAQNKGLPSIYGTAKGYNTDEDIDAIRRELAGCFGTRIEKIRLSAVSSSDLFDNYQRLMIR